jgi:DNA polymerase
VSRQSGRNGVADQRSKSLLDEEIRACGKCTGLNVKGVTEAAAGFGSLRSPVAIVGQSLCRPCMKKQEPFVGGSGTLLDAGFAQAGISKEQLFVTNVVHCHPPKNKKSLRLWIENCSPYLHRELEIVHPRLVIGLGKDAEAALRDFYGDTTALPWPFRTPSAAAARKSLRLHFIKHPSWIKRQHDEALEGQYVRSLARAVRWGFGL